MKQIPAALIAAVILAACNPPEARQVSEPPVAAAEPAPDAVDDCASAADLFDTLVKRKAEGWTEADALADLSAAGLYSFGYVVDGVFGSRFGDGGSAMARADTLAACRRMAEGDSLY